MANARAPPLPCPSNTAIILGETFLTDAYFVKGDTTRGYADIRGCSELSWIWGLDPVIT